MSIEVNKSHRFKESQLQKSPTVKVDSSLAIKRLKLPTHKGFGTDYVPAKEEIVNKHGLF